MYEVILYIRGHALKIRGISTFVSLTRAVIHEE